MIPGGGHNNPSSICLENPMDRGAWQVTVNGVTQSRTRLQKLSSVQHACSRYSTLYGTAFQHFWMIHNETHWTLWNKHNWNTFHKIILTFIMCDASDIFFSVPLYFRKTVGQDTFNWFLCLLMSPWVENPFSRKFELRWGVTFKHATDIN